MSSDSLVDTPALQEVIAAIADENVLRQIYNTYKVSCANALGLMEQYATAGDVRSMQRISHKLKGSSLNFGARRLAALLEKIESTGAESPREVLVDMHKEAENLVAKTLDQLDEAIPKFLS